MLSTEVRLVRQEESGLGLAQRCTLLCRGLADQCPEDARVLEKTMAANVDLDSLSAWVWVCEPSVQQHSGIRAFYLDALGLISHCQSCPSSRLTG